MKKFTVNLILLSFILFLFGCNASKAMSGVPIFTEPTINYTVTYLGNGNTGGAIPSDNTRYAKDATVAVLCNPGELVKAGYYFLGWNTAADGSGTTYTHGTTLNISEDITLYALWTDDQVFNVTYDGNENDRGTVPENDFHYKLGHNVTLIGNTGNLGKQGYKFIGWNTAVDGTGTSYDVGDKFEIPDSNITLYAEWEVITIFSVSYDGNGATSGGIPTANRGYHEGDIVEVLDNTGNFARSGYYFVGWNTTTDDTGITYTRGYTFTIDATDVVLYARWTNNPTFTLTYDGNGNTGGTPPVIKTYYEQGQSAIVVCGLHRLTKSDYKFIGWNTAADGSGTKYLHDDVITFGAENITLYAQWSSDPTYSLVYDGNGNDSGDVPVKNTEYYPGDIVRISENSGNLKKTHYYFNGWNTAADGSGTTYTPSNNYIIGTTDVILHAKWAPIQTYSVIYHGNGQESGSPPVDSNTYYEGDTFKIQHGAGTLKTRGSYLYGWNSQVNGKGNNYYPWETYTMGNSDLHLYAVWESYYRVGSYGPGNGIVFWDLNYYNEDGWRYLEVSEGDINNMTNIYYHFNLAWWSSAFQETKETGATENAIGSGKRNTEKIVNILGKQYVYLGINYEVKYAAQLCSEYKHSWNDYDDWFLPSIYELELLYNYFALAYQAYLFQGIYWSSTEYDSDFAWAFDFDNGVSVLKDKNFEANVRAIRMF